MTVNLIFLTKPIYNCFTELNFQTNYFFRKINLIFENSGKFAITLTKETDLGHIEVQFYFKEKSFYPYSAIVNSFRKKRYSQLKPKNLFRLLKVISTLVELKYFIEKIIAFSDHLNTFAQRSL